MPDGQLKITFISTQFMIFDYHATSLAYEEENKWNFTDPLKNEDPIKYFNDQGRPLYAFKNPTIGHCS